MWIRTVTFAALAALTSCAIAQNAPGREISPWNRGTLEIHQISTGRGNAGLYIFPDGTTLLVDAGELAGKNPRHTPDRPNDSLPAGEWITRYIRHALRHAAQPSLDYVLLTHFHGDHMGVPGPNSPVSRSGAFKLTGVTFVGEHLKITKLLDRGWPDYNYPVPLEDATMKNYRAFLTWQMKNQGLQVERFGAGRKDQVVLLHEPGAYRDFEFRNIGANGEIWTGVGSTTRQHFPALDTVPRAEWPSENMCSISFRLSYGKFDFFNGGDIVGIPAPGFPRWHDVETPVAQVVGPVEAAILNHHGYIDTMNEFFIAALRPRVWTLSVWDSGHPTSAVWHRLQSTRLYPGPRDIFATDLHPGVRVVISGIEKLASDRGHIVIRVSQGGGEFQVLIVENQDESHHILKVFGPYRCN